jgi:hypothetical protein
MLPMSLKQPLAERSRRVRARYERDLTKGGGYVELPDVLSNKVPYAEQDFRWQFVFGSTAMRRDEQGRGYRWHAHPGVLSRTVAQAARRAQVSRTENGTGAIFLTKEESRDASLIIAPVPFDFSVAGNATR